MIQKTKGHVQPKLIPIGVKHDMIAFLRTGEMDTQATDVQSPWRELLQAMVLAPPLQREETLEAYCELHDLDSKEIGIIFEEAKMSPDKNILLREEHIPDEKSWPILPEEAKYGLAWELVQYVIPNTEADSSAILLAFLVQYGNMIGRNAFIRGGDEHYGNEFLLLVGESAVARKGTGFNVARRVLKQIDPVWHDERNTTGAGSGEALIDLVRDPRVDQIIVKDPDNGGDLIENGKPVKVQVTKDVGVEDKRLLWWASEFSRILHLIDRPGNTMPDILREGWDGGTLENNVRTNPAKAKNAHFSLISAVTVPELLKYLSGNELTNGFANRFLWCMTKRSKNLSEGGDDSTLTPMLLAKLREPLLWLHDTKQGPHELRRTPAARDLWDQMYRKANEPRPGMYGQIVARAAQHMIRLQLIFAVLDNKRQVDVQHVLAAHAVWRYCAASIRYVFGTTVSDEIADFIYQGLKEHSGGLTLTSIQNVLFGGKKEALKVKSALTILASQGLAKKVQTRQEGATRGRYSEVWYAIDDTALDDY